MALLKPFQKIVITQLLQGYNYQEPFHVYFHKQSKKHRNWGSRDRKIYKHFCYQYFRLGQNIKNLTIAENIDLIDQIDLSAIDLNSIFPYPELISTHVNYLSWVSQILIQSPVFLVIRDGKKDQVFNWLKTKDIEFQQIGAYTLKLKADVKCNELIENGWVWIMDLASQMVVNNIDIDDKKTLWDCCSGAGGKALLLKQQYPNLSIMCSDNRVSILENLRVRFSTLKMNIPHIELIDLNEKCHIDKKFDIVIADVPCSGSGTWGRHPESIQSFSINTPFIYANKQRQIVKNALNQLKEKGTFCYITCSVFKSENEDNVAFFEEEYGLKLVSQKAFYDTEHSSDFLYMAVFNKE